MISDDNGGLPRYCTPFHGGWDVARIALNIPQSRILFVCPASCARIICLNALKYGYKEKISVLGLTEQDIALGDYEFKTVEAAKECLRDEKTRPRMLILYVSCIDSMLGTDHSRQIEEIKEEYPGVEVILLKMNPICRDSGDLPLVQLQHDMYAPLPPAPVPKSRKVGFIGTNIPFFKSCELIRAVKDGGYEPVHIGNMKSYDEYLDMRSCALNVCIMPFGRTACELMKQRYGIPYVPIFMTYDRQKIKGFETAVCSALGVDAPDFETCEKEALDALRSARPDRETVVDMSATLDTPALAELLTDCGYKVKNIYIDAQSNDPSGIIVDSGSIDMPAKRRFDAQKLMSVGMVSSCFAAADSTVDIFYDGGLFGFDGIKRLAAMIKEADRQRETAASVRGGERR